jgi:hypothetical protein
MVKSSASLSHYSPKWFDKFRYGLNDQVRVDQTPLGVRKLVVTLPIGGATLRHGPKFFL